MPAITIRPYRLFNQGLSLFLALILTLSPLLTPLAYGQDNPVNPPPESLQEAVGNLDSSLQNLKDKAAPVIHEIELGNVSENIASRQQKFLDNFRAEARKWETDRGLNTTGDEIAYITGNKGSGHKTDQFLGSVKNSLGALLHRIKGVKVPENSKAKVELQAIADEAESKLQTTESQEIPSFGQSLKAKLKAWSDRNSLQPDTKKYAGALEGAVGEATAQPKWQMALSHGSQRAVNSVRHGFSAGGLATTVGISLTSQLITQMVEKGRVDPKGAVKTLVSAEFGASVVGSVLGGAGGHLLGGMAQVLVPGFLGSFLGAMLPTLGASFTGQMFSNLTGNVKASKKLMFKEAWKKIDKAQLVGSSVGSTVGAILGSFIPVPFVGPILGSIIGGMVGGKLAKYARDSFKPRVENLVNVVRGRVGNQKLSEYKTTAGSDSSSNAGIGKIRIHKTGGDLKLKHDQYMAAFASYDEALKNGDTKKAKSAYKKLQKTQRDYHQARGE